MALRREVTSTAWLAGMLLCIFPGLLPAQRYSFRHYEQEDGLTNPNVRSLAQDGTGYIWVGTRRGLFRYDGERFVAFHGSSALPSRSIRTLKPGPDGSLWVASESGLTRINGDRDDNVELPEPIDNSADGGLDIGPDGTVYMATNAGVLVVRDPAAKHLKAEFQSGAPRSFISALHITADGTLWIAADLRIVRLNPRHPSVAFPPMDVPRDHWEGIASDRHGAIWIRSLNRLMELPQNAHRFEVRGQGLPESRTTAVLSVDSKGNIYVPTDSGLAYIDPDTNAWKLVSSKQGLLSDSINCLLQDREDSVWLGLSGGGLARWLGFGEWSSWTHQEGLANDVVWAIQRSRQGGLLVGTDGGLTLLPVGPSAAGRKLRTWTEQDGLAGNHVRAMRYDGNGDLWMASAPGGLSVMDGVSGRIQAFGKESGLGAGSVYTLAFARGLLWVGTSAGIYRGDPRDGDFRKGMRFQHVDLPGSDPFEAFLTLAVDSKDRLWAAGSKGLVFWDGAQWTRLFRADAMEGEFIAVAAFEDEVWAGTEAKGVFRIWGEPGHFQVQHIDASNGLSSGVVYVIGSDAAGKVWIGGDTGVDVFLRNGEVSGAPGSWSHLSSVDGLAWNDTDVGAFLAEKPGTVWLGTSRGLSRYQPGEKKATEYPPVLILNATDEKHQPLSPDQYQRIPLTGHPIQFHFSALTYRNETGVRFQYRLQPVDAAWLETDQRRISFPALSSGSYTFEVRVRNPEGSWSKPEIISFRVIAPWWKNLWTLAAAVAAAALLLRFFYRFRMRRLVQAKTELEAAVGARTRELEREKSELLVARELLSEKAMRDGLTGLWNRAAICEILQRELHRTRRGERPVAIMLADLDHFKNINDSHGHHAGDAVLVETARKIARNMRSYDSGGRYGGEEFLLVLSNCTHGSVLDRAEELRRTIASDPVKLPSMEISITCSIGVAVSTGDITIHELIQQADEALYKAKREGRNRVKAAFETEGLVSTNGVANLALALGPGSDLGLGDAESEEGILGDSLMDRMDTRQQRS